METQNDNKKTFTWKNRTSFGLKIFMGVSMAVFFAFIFGYFVMLLWNWLMPELFGLTTITYWHAFGIIILARLIFGHFGPNHPTRDSRKDFRYNKFHSKWKCSDNDRNDWKHYENFWEDEGKQAFNNYVETKKQAPQE